MSIVLVIINVNMSLLFSTYFLPPSLKPTHSADAVIAWASPGKFVQVGEDSLRDALYEVVVQAEGVDADQQGDGLPGDVYQVVVAQIQVLQGL